MGLGEGVVSGTVTPDTYWMDKVTGKILKNKSVRKRQCSRKTENGQTVQVPVPNELKNKQVLNEHELAQLVELGKTFMNTTNSHKTQNGPLKMVKYSCYNPGQ